jgi:thiamine transport system permease protein
MAVGNEPLTAPGGLDRRVAAGIAALGFVALVVIGAFAGLLDQAAGHRADAIAAFDIYMLRVARFTLWQALLSTALSVVPAILVARALSRQAEFPGRRLILQVFAVPLALPSIVAALGVIALYGRAGYVSDLAAAAGGGTWPSIYGLSGILIAHTFFNLPLATRLLLEALENLPADQLRLAAQLGMGAGASFRFLEWPAMRAVLPGVAGLDFMLCATSFTIVLTLGGGPAATTLEVGIYQALRFDFDPARAASLTFVQILLTALIVMALTRLGAGFTAEANLSVARRHSFPRGRPEAVVNAAVIILAALFVAGPMAATVAAGFSSDIGRLVMEPAVLRAAGTSLGLSVLAALLGVGLSFALVAARRSLEMRRGSSAASLFERIIDYGPGMILVVPPVVIGAGWFILLMHSGAVFSAAPIMVVAVNALMAMPFAVRVIRPAHDAASARHEKLCSALGITGLDRLRLVDWPALRRPAAMAFAFAMALSLGDLGVIALFGSDSVQTLPYLLLARMSSYRTTDAAGIALILGLICLALMMAADRLGRQAR